MQAYVDDSAKHAMENGGTGIYINLKDGSKKKNASEIHRKRPKQLLCRSWNFEVGSENYVRTKKLTHPQAVLFMDTLSAVSALQNLRNIDLTELHEICLSLSQAFPRDSADCQITGNNKADQATQNEGSLFHNISVTQWD